MARSLLLVVAHPDDDAYAVAGSIALAGADPTFRWVLVHATDGGAGEVAPGVAVGPEGLGARRREEARRAWLAHGTPPARHEWLGYPDGGVAQVPRAELVARITEILADERPDVVVTFGPDGITGHPDHVTVGAATDEAFDRVAATPGPGLHRLLHGALPASAFERWNARRVAAGQPPWDPTQVFHLRGVPDERIGVSVDTSAVAHRVVAGLREHRSQAHVLTDGDDDAALARRVSSEHLVVARPAGPAPRPRLTNLFDGLAD